MKKILLIIVLLIPIKVLASSYIVMDNNTGRVLLGKDINSQSLIASTTKIMTSIVALENGDLDDLYKVSNEILKVDGSMIYLSLNEHMSLKDLLYGLLLRSGNDASITISTNVFHDRKKFIEEMNNLASKIGMHNTKFINESGLEEKDGNGNISTPYDMALLMRYALLNNTFKEIIHTKNYVTKTDMKSYTWQNKNKLLSSYKYEVGGKTGYTKKAGRTLVTSSYKDGKSITIVTFRDSDDFNTHKKLSNYVFNNYDNEVVLAHNNIIINGNLSNYYLKEDTYMLLNNKDKKNIRVEYIINDLEKKAKVYLYNKEVISKDIYMDNNKKNISFLESLWKALKHD